MKICDSYIIQSEVLIITIRTGFPNGMAATRRILLIAKALRSANIKAAVIHLDTSEISEPFKNNDVKGCFQGIPFLYASGKVDRGNSFISRQLLSIKGILTAFNLVLQCKYSGNLKAVIFYERNIFYLAPILLLCKIVGITFALDLVEWPTAMEVHQKMIGRISLRMYRILALRFADKITAISHFLFQKASEIHKGDVRVMYLPILGDYAEQSILRKPVPGKFVISISSTYSEELVLVLKAFSRILSTYPNATLHITGGFSSKDLQAIITSNDLHTQAKLLFDSVKCRGYLNRSNLIELFATSCAGIVSLTDDLRSRSRMPTKIAEYTMHGIPLITGNIGDTKSIFKDGDNAFIYTPNDEISLAETMLRVLSKPKDTETVGRNGKSIAEKLFFFKKYSQPLSSFLLNTTPAIQHDDK